MTAHLDVVRAWRDDATAQLSAPELDNRGRKRHRSLTRCNASVKCGTSGESSTLRGRPRRRSTSPYGAASRTTSRGAMDGSASPARKRLLRVVVLDRRRSQSPSRSRSPNRRQQNAARRRQRTRSRSRSHDEKSSLCRATGMASGMGMDMDMGMALGVVAESTNPQIR
ncbi:hypothetical protein EV126DRAFT_507616 [Verticillium dahliae]|nr:hypothetical protein EV126DRAFT_507616 [Verticillium dahliae]